MSFGAGQRLTYPILLDEAGEMGNAYRMRSLPTLFFINGEGTIHEVVIGGPMTEDSLRERVEQILK